MSRWLRDLRRRRARKIDKADRDVVVKAERSARFLTGVTHTYDSLQTPDIVDAEVYNHALRLLRDVYMPEVPDE